MINVTSWNRSDMGFAYRAFPGGMYSHEQVAFIAFKDRIARVRVREATRAADALNWAQMPDELVTDDESMFRWCDDMLELLGYHIP